MRRFISAALLFATLAGLTACGTVAGAGEDISHAARWTQRLIP